MREGGPRSHRSTLAMGQFIAPLRQHMDTWNGGDGYDNGIAPVGSYPNGKSYYGAMDMGGNVWEWTADWYSDAYYTYNPKRNPKGPDTGSWRAIRGGAWTNDINRCAVTSRLQFYPSLKTSFIGFRLARTTTPCPSAEKSMVRIVSDVVHCQINSEVKATLPARYPVTA